MRIDPGFYDPATGAGVETLIATPCFGVANWATKAGYLRLKAAGTVQVQVWGGVGGGQWHNHGLSTLTRDGGCQSWQLRCTAGDGGGFLVWRVRLDSDTEATVPLDACIEILPA